jgi:transcriptional regulator with XRE-family HTH domain
MQTKKEEITMILANKIINERKKCGWSQEELADKLMVSRQSVSKWESAQAVPDLQRIIQMAEIFGVSTDYLLKDDIEGDTTVITEGTEIVYSEEPATVLRRVTMKEANDYLDMKRRVTPFIALGVSMCIVSPVVLLILSALSEQNIIAESLAVIIGLIVLFGLIAGAVFMFIIQGSKEEQFKYLKDGGIDTEYGIDGMVKEKKEAFMPIHNIRVAIGVVMCILSPVPLVIAALAEASETIEVLMVALMLVIIASAVNMFINVGNIKEGYDVLLQEGDFTIANKEVNKKAAPLAGAYWSLVTAGYLAWSFLSGNWHITWIVWPVAGVAFGVIKAFFPGIESQR